MASYYFQLVIIAIPLILSYPLIDIQLKHKNSNFYYVLFISSLLYTGSVILGYYELELLYALLTLIYPLFFYFYYYHFSKFNKLISIFYSLFLYLAFETTDTFLSVILSSIIGDSLVNQFSFLFVLTVSVLSILIIIKIISIFEVDLLYFKERIFKKFVQQLIGVYLIITLTLNTSHWLSNIAHFNSFGSMIATICFLIFLGTLVQMKTVRDRYEKKMELKQKKFEQRQMEQYMDKIQDLYAELKGFRHDFGNIITSLNLAIEERDLEDIKRIKRDVLEECYGELQKEEYTGFDLGNIRDSALRSILSRGWIYAEKLGVKLKPERLLKNFQ